MIVSDNGTELTSNAVLVWYGVIGVEWHYIAPRQSGSYRFVGWISIASGKLGRQTKVTRAYEVLIGEVISSRNWTAG